jgi:membrane protease YdiL (CAAX protease family)
MKPTSLRAANSVYCLSLALALLMGDPLQRWNSSAGLIAAESLLIVPALLAAPRPKRAALRLRWPGWNVCLISAVLGATVWPLSAALSVLSAVVSGPHASNRPAGFPSVAFLFAVTVFPAFCEELVFRGYIQSAYERRGARAGIFVPALLFLCFHLPARRFVELIPAALLFGFLAWSTQSVIPGMLAHFALNSMSAMWAYAMATGTIPALLPALGVALAASPLIAVAALWALRQALDA